MKITPLLLCLFLPSLNVFAQWTTSGTSIYYNSGNVGIGTTSPSTLLEVKAGIDLYETSTQYVGPYVIGGTNDFGGGGAHQFILLIPQFNGTVGEAAAGISGILREYRGNPGSYNAPFEYDIVAQTAYSNSFINLIPRSTISNLLNVYSVTYMGIPYLAINASDMILSGGTCTFSGHFWNNINSTKPQLVLASACSNISVFQSATYYAGGLITTEASGFVGIGTTTPQAFLNVVGSGVSIDTTTYSYSGDLSIQANTGGRSTTSGAQLEFVIPANTDGTNLWGQGRIITVAGNTTGANATGKMVLGTRRYFNKLGSGSNWYYGNDITIDGSGNVGIGTLNPQSLLSVEGIITAKELNITQTNWSDFVFDSAYQQMPLDKVASYVRQYRHLPDIPSLAQIEQGGLDIGVMQKLQMQKIEELTLYAIKHDSIINQQQMLLDRMEARLNEQAEELKRLENRSGL